MVLTDGEISWDDNEGDFDWTRTNAVPRVLSRVFSEEPLWVDLRPIVKDPVLRTSLSRSNAEFINAVARLSASIRGIADFNRVVSEDYRQHRRTIWTARLVAGLLACITAAAVWQWTEARTERDVARIQLLAAQARRADAEARTPSLMASPAIIERAGALALESFEQARRRNRPAEADALEAARRAL
jgi:hypothetical protein